MFVSLQFATGCLDVALQLLQGLSADDRRNAATITKCIVAQVLCGNFVATATLSELRMITTPVANV